MSVAIDLYLMNEAQIVKFQKETDLETIEIEPTTIWEFTNFEVDEIGNCIGKETTREKPVRYNEGEGLVIFAWSPEFVGAVTELSDSKIADIIAKLTNNEDLAHIKPDIIKEGVEGIIRVCRQAIVEEKQIIQIEGF